MELLTSTASTKRIINSIFIFLQFFFISRRSSLLFFHSSTSLKFIHIFFLHPDPVERQQGAMKIPFSAVLFLLSKLKRFNWSEVDSAKATLELRDLFNGGF